MINSKRLLYEFMCKLMYILPCYENLTNCRRQIHHNNHYSRRRPRYYRLSNYRRRIRL